MARILKLPLSSLLLSLSPATQVQRLTNHSSHHERLWCLERSSPYYTSRRHRVVTMQDDSVVQRQSNYT